MARFKSIFIFVLVSIAGWGFIFGCHGRDHLNQGAGRKFLILGIDAMDPQILERMTSRGELPHFRQLMQKGGYRHLQTTVPPESPVAWSSFITGTNPGGHGIFDFIHRDPSTLTPHFSISRAVPSQHSLSLGKWIIPLGGGEMELLRQGRSFWEILSAHHIPASILRIPANFPPVKTRATQLAGMGTPDILGTYGTFTFFTDEPEARYQGISGGEVVSIVFNDFHFKSHLNGPANSFRTGNPPCQLDLDVYLDPENPIVRVDLSGQKILLQEKEWSPWIRISFPVLPGIQSVPGICRFYLKEARPQFKLYVSPINLDPTAPALPISEPAGYSAELAAHIGLFHTLGIPEDANALSAGVLDDHEFLEQAQVVLDEENRMFEYELKRFHQGVLFFYIGSIDQLQHMFWRCMDPTHPAFSTCTEKEPVIESAYRKMDLILKQALDALGPEDTLLALSDHGFAPFARSFQLGTWLKNNGYTTLTNFSEGELLNNVDWQNSRAYALGFSGLYLNLRGREAHGIVDSGREKEALLNELKSKLEAIRDPETGEAVIHRAYKTEEFYSGPFLREAPDLIVGYNRGYRASWETALGRFPRRELIEKNLQKWSGDHLMSRDLVPGVLLSNRTIRMPAPALTDLAPTILQEFSLPPGAEMRGKSVF
jgi:predicted AlkP superfamily phosphohydrolase/phosphomutase